MSRTIKIMLILCIFYLVGLVGLSISDYRTFFAHLTPYNLLLTLVIFLVANNRLEINIYVALFVISIAGYFLEVAGVVTGKLFGSYNYGTALGYQLWNVPLIIGVNWFILSLATFGILNQLNIHFSSKAFMGAIMMTAVDYVIEPVAIQLDFWHWNTPEIPLQNYLMWFIVSYIFQLLIHYIKPSVNKVASLFVLSMQVIFFILLNILL